jgi:hydroxypyruvate isomerase
MPIFSANLTLLFGEVPFLERFAAAAACGFRSVEFLFPYGYQPADIRDRLSAAGLSLDLFNLPAGDFAAGERGSAVDSSRRAEFRTGVQEALRYAAELGTVKLNCLVGLRVPDEAPERQYAALIAYSGESDQSVRSFRSPSGRRPRSG